MTERSIYSALIVEPSAVADWQPKRADPVVLSQLGTSVLPFGHGKPQILHMVLGSSEATKPPCQSDSGQGAKACCRFVSFSKAIGRPRNLTRRKQQV